MPSRARIVVSILLGLAVAAGVAPGTAGTSYPTRRRFGSADGSVAGPGELPGPYDHLRGDGGHDTSTGFLRPEEGHGPRWGQDRIRAMMADDSTQSSEPNRSTATDKLAASADRGSDGITATPTTSAPSLVPTHRRYPAAHFGSDANLADLRLETVINHRHHVTQRGHLAVLRNPINHFTVLEPENGCGGNPARVRTSDTARSQYCAVATNAGFFNTHTGACLGNLIVNGSVVQLPATQNANFGITKGGEFVTGYLNRSEIADFDFHTLVAGVVWLVRDGVNYVNASAQLEDMSVQETGGTFVTVEAPRTAIGHNAAGQLMLYQVDGKDGTGVGLSRMADDLITFGAVNAINLDGGGSTTFVLDGTVTNYPTDYCESGYSLFRCERAVTSITCVHDSPNDFLYPAPEEVCADICATECDARIASWSAPEVCEDWGCADLVCGGHPTSTAEPTTTTTTMSPTTATPTPTTTTTTKAPPASTTTTTTTTTTVAPATVKPSGSDQDRVDAIPGADLDGLSFVFGIGAGVVVSVGVVISYLCCRSQRRKASGTIGFELLDDSDNDGNDGLVFTASSSSDEVVVIASPGGIVPGRPEARVPAIDP